MKRTFLSNIGILVILTFSAFISGCNNKGQSIFFPPSDYTINGVKNTSQANRNLNYNSIEVPCKDNNAIHLYYSPALKDSLIKNNFFNAILFGPKQLNLKVVSNLRAGNLKWNECYFEVNTSATDTWLSTGADNKFVDFSSATGLVLGESDRTTYEYDFTDIAVQHWTSVPLNEFGKVSGTLIVENYY